MLGISGNAGKNANAGQRPSQIRRCWRLHRNRALIIFSLAVILDCEFMKVDEVITVPADVEAIKDAMHEMFARADGLIEKYDLQPPVRTRLLDGHGNQLLSLEANWDENGNRLPTPEGKWPLAETQASGMFLMIEDSQGKTDGSQQEDYSRAGCPLPFWLSWHSLLPVLQRMSGVGNGSDRRLLDHLIELLQYKQLGAITFRAFQYVGLPDLGGVWSFWSTRLWFAGVANEAVDSCRSWWEASLYRWNHRTICTRGPPAPHWRLCRSLEYELRQTAMRSCLSNHFSLVVGITCGI